MRHLMLSLFVAAGLAPWLGACSSDTATATQPMIASEGECRAASPSYRCKYKHDLGGGYPFTLDQSNDPG